MNRHLHQFSNVVSDTYQASSHFADTAAINVPVEWMIASLLHDWKVPGSSLRSEVSYHDCGVSKFYLSLPERTRVKYCKYDSDHILPVTRSTSRSSRTCSHLHKVRIAQPPNQTVAGDLLPVIQHNWHEPNHSPSNSEVTSAEVIPALKIHFYIVVNWHRSDFRLSASFPVLSTSSLTNPLNFRRYIL